MFNRKIWIAILPLIIIALGCLYTMRMDYYVNIYFDMTAKDMKTYTHNESPLHYKILEYLNNRIIESPEKVKPALLKYLGDPDRDKSWIAYDFLGKLKINAFEKYTACLKSPYEHTREYAARLLEQDSRTIEVLTEKLEDEKTSTDEKKACLSALKLQNGTRASEATVKLLKSADPELRALAVRKLWDNYNHYYDVMALANDESSLVRIEVLNRLHSGVFDEKCLDFLNDKDEVVVAKAIEKVSRYSDKRVIPALEKFVKTTKSEDLKKKASALIEEIKRNEY